MSAAVRLSAEAWAKELREGGSCCPVCRESSGTVRHTGGDFTTLWQTVTCDNDDCEGVWSELYELTGCIDDTEESDGACHDLREKGALMDAAPDLLAALQALLAHEGEINADNGLGIEFDSDELIAAREKAHAAIAKAVQS